MVTAQEVVGSTPAEFTKSTSKTKQTPENKDFQEFFFFPDLPKIQQNEAVKTGEIGGLYSSPGVLIVFQKECATGKDNKTLDFWKLRDRQRKAHPRIRFIRYDEDSMEK